MTKFKRRLLWGITLALLLLVGLAVYAYFIGTRTFLEHAEALSFRRMTVTRLAEPGVYRFFYATNRVPGNADGPVEERFGADREESLKFGSFDTAIQPTLGLGMLINPSDWFLNEEIQLKNLQALAQEAFVEQLREQVEASPHP